MRKILLSVVVGGMALACRPALAQFGTQLSPAGCYGTTTATASACVQRDGNANAFANTFVPNFTSTASSGATVAMTAGSSQLQVLTGTSSQQNNLPDATTLALGWPFTFNNNSSQSWTIANNGGSSQYVVPAGGFTFSFATGIGSANGSWDFHPLPPSTVTWGSGTTGLIFNTALSGSAAIGAGTASCTSSVPFQPARSASTTGWSGTSSGICGVVGGVTVIDYGITTASTLTVTGPLKTTGQFFLGAISSATASPGIFNYSTGNQLTFIGGTSGFAFNNAADTTNEFLIGNTGTLTLATGVYASCTGFTSNASAVLACTASDARLKKDEGEISGSLAIKDVMALSAHAYAFKDANLPGSDDREHFGFFAQNVQGLFPQLVKRSSIKTRFTPDGELQFDKTELIAVEWAAIQQQQREINKIKTQLAAIQRRRH